MQTKPRSGKLHVLVVEDSETDAELLLQVLGQNGFDLTFERVQTAEQMEAALGRQKWEIVLADYSMPSFNGMQALQLLRAKGFDIPFISVSGSRGEDLAVEMMKAGAGDYIMKGDLRRLIPAIERELLAARVREEAAKAEATMQYLASIVEFSDDAIYGNQLDGVVMSWNRGAERMYGYSADEMIGNSIAVLLPEDRKHEIEEIRNHVILGESLERYETVRQHKSGRLINVSLTVSPIKNREGDILGAAIVARDITRHKQEEAERTRLISELKEALTEVKTLHGLLPICASCKSIRNDKGYWERVEIYIEKHTHAEFTHGLCPTCIQKLYPEAAARIESMRA